jgi:hypothetical protein
VAKRKPEGAKMIEQWLRRFNDAWTSHDADGVIALFSEDVQYYETPFRKLQSIEFIRSEWTAIKNQFDIQLTTSVYSEHDGRYTVKWNLFYSNESHEKKHWAGIYLIELNDGGKCTYFYQVGEQSLNGNS